MRPLPQCGGRSRREDRLSSYTPGAISSSAEPGRANSEEIQNGDDHQDDHNDRGKRNPAHLTLLYPHPEDPGCLSQMGGLPCWFRTGADEWLNPAGRVSDRGSCRRHPACPRLRRRAFPCRLSWLVVAVSVAWVRRWLASGTCLFADLGLSQVRRRVSFQKAIKLHRGNEQLGSTIAAASANRLLISFWPRSPFGERNMRLAARIALPRVERRGTLRFSASIDGAVRGGDDLQLSAAVVNISSHGCRIEVQGKLPEAALVKLKLGSAGFFDARVMWSTVGSAGLEFLQPLHPDLVHHLIAPPSRPQ